MKKKKVVELSQYGSQGNQKQDQSQFSQKASKMNTVDSCSDGSAYNKNLTPTTFSCIPWDVFLYFYIRKSGS